MKRAKAIRNLGILLAAIGGMSGLIWLSAPFLLRRAEDYAAKYLRTYGIEFSYAHAGWTWSRGLDVQDGEVHYATPGVRADFSFRQLRLQLHADIWRRELHVEELSLQSPHLVYISSAEQNSRSNVAPQTTSKAPPASILSIKKFRLEDLEIHAVINENRGIDLHHARLQAAADWKIDRWSLSAEYDLGRDDRIYVGPNAYALEGQGHIHAAGTTKGIDEGRGQGRVGILNSRFPGLLKYPANIDLAYDFAKPPGAAGAELSGHLKLNGGSIADLQTTLDYHQGDFVSEGWVEAKVDPSLRALSAWATLQPNVKATARLSWRGQANASGDADGHVDLKVPRWRVAGLASPASLSLNTIVRNRPADGLEVSGAARVENKEWGRGEFTGRVSRRASGRLAIAGVLSAAKYAPRVTLDIQDLDPQRYSARTSVRLDPPGLNFAGEIRGDPNRRDLRVHGRWQIGKSGATTTVVGHRFNGMLRAPLTLSVFGGSDIALDGNVEFENFAWASSDFGVTGVTGKIPLRERLIFKAGRLSYGERLREDAFERVDFNRVRPLLRGAVPLKIDKILWHERQYGPLHGFLSLRQNLFSLHQFDLDLVAGKSSGEMFLDFDPPDLRLGFLGRLTGLNLTEFLPESFMRRLDRHTRDLSARAGVVYDLRRANLDGRIDVTEIGERQLLALVNLLDPGYRDEKINKLRGLLQLGYPTGVNANLREGFVDLDVELSVLGLNTRRQIRSIPLSGLIDKYTRGWAAQLAESTGK